MAEITVKGLDNLSNYLRSIPLKLRQPVHNALQQGGELIADKARQIVPVRTGYLKSTIYSKVKGNWNIEVGAYAPYGGYVEYGTSRQRAQPYLRPAFYENRAKIVELVRQAVKQALEI